MAIPSPRILFRIGTILAVTSIVLFGISISQIGSGGENFPAQSIASHTGGKLIFSNSVSAGDDLEYVVSPTSYGNGSLDLTVYLISPNNQSVAYSNLTLDTPLSKVIIAPYSGTWQMGFHNNANSTVNFTVSMAVVPFLSLFMLDLALALLVSGGGLLILAYAIRRKEISIAMRRNY